MQYEFITDPPELTKFCDRIADASVIAFDTEFVSEDSYRPDLCLIQVAAKKQLAVIDTTVCADVSPFWGLLAEGNHRTLVHAGREEFRFCRRAIGKRPVGWFDVQIAAGMIGLEFPAAYGTLISKLLGKSLQKGETRTDWRRRPLSPRQIEYALRDVYYLEPLYDLLNKRLDELGRLSWIDVELADWQDKIEEAETAERWRRVSGISGLDPRMLAIARELWTWREAQAEQRDCSPKRILSDDLITELARRRSADIKRIRAVRGMERRNLQRHLPELSQAIKRALQLPDDELPDAGRPSARPHVNLLAQFLATALNSLCRSADVAPSLVGTVQDVRDLIAYHFKLDGENVTPPLLASGWRAEIVGQVIDDLLDGKLALRITDPFSDHPLALEELEPNGD